MQGNPQSSVKMRAGHEETKESLGWMERWTLLLAKWKDDELSPGDL